MRLRTALLLPLTALPLMFAAEAGSFPPAEAVKRMKPADGRRPGFM